MPAKDKNNTSRKRGKDKQKDRFNKYGKYSSRSLRFKEASQGVSDQPVQAESSKPNNKIQ